MWLHSSPLEALVVVVITGTDRTVISYININSLVLWRVRVWWDRWETRRIDPRELVPTTCLHSRYQNNRPQSLAVTRQRVIVASY